jgi:hypothetical protein
MGAFVLAEPHRSLRRCQKKILAHEPQCIEGFPACDEEDFHLTTTQAGYREAAEPQYDYLGLVVALDLT